MDEGTCSEKATRRCVSGWGGNGDEEGSIQMRRLCDDEVGARQNALAQKKLQGMHWN